MYDNNDYTNAFVYMVYTGGSDDERSDNDNYQQHSGGLDEINIDGSIFSSSPSRKVQPNRKLCLDFFNAAVVDNNGNANVNVNSISDTKTLHHTLLKSSMIIKTTTLSIPTPIWIYNLADFLRVHSMGSLNLRLLNSDLPMK